MTDQVTQQFEVDIAELELVQQLVAANPEGVRVEIIEERDGEGIAPLFVIIVIGAAAFIGGVAAYLAERRLGGQVIDLRDGAPKAHYRTKDVQYGLVVIHTADGKVTVEVHEPEGFFGQVINHVLEAVSGIVTKSITAVADAAKQAAGERATVTAEPSGA
jgi:hypothetical protein